MAVDLSVDRDSEVPLGTQLAWKLRTAIATGSLQPREQLPGVRELAEVAGLNVNTVRSVYARLEERGLVTSEHGRGTFVAPGAGPREDLARLLSEAGDLAREAGVDPRDLAAALFVGAGPDAPASGQPVPAEPASTSAAAASPADRPSAAAPPQRADERARRRALRSEIARLEGELVHLARLGDAAATPSLPAGRILTAEELEEVRVALVSRLAELRRDRDAALRRRSEEAAGAAPETERYRDAGVWTGGAARVAWRT